MEKDEPAITDQPTPADFPIAETSVPDPEDESEEEYQLSWSERLGLFVLHRARLLFWLILVLAAVLRLGRIGEHGVRADENFLSTSAVKDFVKGTIYQSRPPLGYGLATIFGDEILAGRVLSALFGIGFVAVVYGLAKELFGTRTALLAMLFAALSPFQILYSQESGSYSLDALLGAGLVWAFYRAWRRNDRPAWGVFGLVLILAIYTSYYLLLTLAAVDLFLAGYLAYERRRTRRWPTRRLRGWAVANGAALVAYLPWLIILLEQGQSTSTATLPTPNLLEPLLSTNVFLLNATESTTGPLLTLAGLILGPVITVFLLNALRFRLRRGELGRQRRSFEVALLLISWWLPLLLVLLLSYLVRPLYTERNLITVAAPLYILLARAIQTSRRPALWLLLLVPGIIVLVGSLYSYYY